MTELGEIGLFVLDYIWHHEMIDAVESVGHQVALVDNKLDLLVNTLSPSSGNRFTQPQQQVPPRFTSQRQVLPSNRRQASSSRRDGRRQQVTKMLPWAIGMNVFGLAHLMAPHVG